MERHEMLWFVLARAGSSADARRWKMAMDMPRGTRPSVFVFQSHLLAGPAVWHVFGRRRESLSCSSS